MKNWMLLSRYEKESAYKMGRRREGKKERKVSRKRKGTLGRDGRE